MGRMVPPLRWHCTCAGPCVRFVSSSLHSCRLWCVPASALLWLLWLPPPSSPPTAISVQCSSGSMIGTTARQSSPVRSAGSSLAHGNGDSEAAEDWYAAAADTEGGR